MTPILKQLAQLVAALAALYGVALAVTLVLVPPNDALDRLDSARAGASLYMTEPKYVFLARTRLDTPADKVVLVGASNMLAGFRQAQMQALLPDAEVHNLSVGGSNVTQVAQIVDLVREVQSPEARRHTTWVIGTWYGLFADDRARWYTDDRHGGDTDIDIERYRYGFYRRTDDGPRPVLPPDRLETGVTLIHPYLVLDRVARDMTRSLRARIAAKPKVITDDERNAVVLTAEQKQAYLAFWRSYMGRTDTLGDAPFRTLEQLIDVLLMDGSRVVLVDMPLPAWHRAGSPLAADYERRTASFFAALRTRPGVSVVPAFEGSDLDFSDEVHPKPRVTAQWARRLATAMTTPPPAALTQSASAQ